MSESYIGYAPDGNARSFVGEEAVDTFRAASLASMLGLLEKGITFKGMTKTRALEEAGKYTGVKYKRGEFAKAKADLQVLVQNKKAALATVQYEA